MPIVYKDYGTLAGIGQMRVLRLVEKHFSVDNRGFGKSIRDKTDIDWIEANKFSKFYHDEL